MTPSRPRPLVGALLGAILGLVTMALLAALGVLAPDRLPLFGLVAVGLIIGAVLLTQRMSLAKTRLIAAMAVGALLGGVALTGIPEVSRGGSVSPGCMVTGTSSLSPDLVSPTHTSILNPFSVTTTDTVQWTTQSSAPATAATGTVSLLIGGFKVPVRNVAFAENPELTAWSGELSVQEQLEAIKDAAGMLATGTYHVAVTIDTEGGQCEGDAYVRVAPDHAFDGLLLILLWVLLLIVIVTLGVLAVIVRKSIRESDHTLAMVGTSAIPGETSTVPPTSAQIATREPEQSGTPSAAPAKPEAGAAPQSPPTTASAPEHGSPKEPPASPPMHPDSPPAPATPASGTVEDPDVVRETPQPDPSGEPDAEGDDRIGPMEEEDAEGEGPPRS